MLVRLLVAALVAAALARRGLKKKSLDVSGAIAASFVGFLTLSSSYRFGVLLLGFYFSGSKLTKVRSSVKQQLDANYKPGGQRSAGQVLACSLLATFIAVYTFLQFGDDDVPIDFTAAKAHSYLLASYIGHYACCAADTWASELGVLSQSKPRLITTLRRVPPGTNGAVSVLGLAVSALGGTFIGVLYYAGSLLSGSAQAQVITLGAVTGLFGSVFDSVLGATVQATYFDRASRKICDESAVGGDVEHVCGVDLLSNEQVNVVSVLVTTAISGVVATYLFP
ncbi:hypothetical protein BBJ29_000933 [Phytophthora kernoviae]|uniref:Transmembrane protein 19 n=1 Tax=Phytophthora kernoviae TaxID=325452 RepID=A0A3F2RXA6_9STRA|nr:hypothetical protein BBJ29_000933 [Phytophthora kernoviae]RLN66074.1 hypothetical protein BBP00_00002442 [Phytophthora kernoviae]